MKANKERALRLFRDKVGTFWRKRYYIGDRSVYINLYTDIIAILEKKDPNIVTTLIALLDDTHAKDMHYWIVSAMYGMAAKGKLTRAGAEAMLKHTETLAEVNDEQWHQSINALVSSSSPEHASVLIDFIENRLLAKCDIRGWRWLAFHTTNAVSLWHKSFITESLRDKLKNEVEKETDFWQKQYFQEVLACINK